MLPRKFCKWLSNPGFSHGHEQTCCINTPWWNHQCAQLGSNNLIPSQAANTVLDSKDQAGPSDSEECFFFNAEGVEKYATGYDWGSSGRLCASQFGVRWDFPLAAFTHSSSKLAVHVNTKEGQEECRRWMPMDGGRGGIKRGWWVGEARERWWLAGQRRQKWCEVCFSCVRLCSRWLGFFLSQCGTHRFQRLKSFLRYMV